VRDRVQTTVAGGDYSFGNVSNFLGLNVDVSRDGPNAPWAIP
jgi:hypothetical protein